MHTYILYFFASSQIEDVMMRLSATARKAAIARQAGTGYARSSLRSLQGEGMPALKYFMETMGCQMNVADSERMEGQLADLGYGRLYITRRA